MKLEKFEAGFEFEPREPKTQKRDYDVFFFSNSEEAELFVVFANTDFSLGYKGITAFLIPSNSPGLSVGKKEDKLCIKASSTCPVHFENVHVCFSDSFFMMKHRFFKS